MKRLSAILLLCSGLWCATAWGQSFKHYELRVNEFRIVTPESFNRHRHDIDRQRLVKAPDKDYIFVNKDHTAHLRFIHHDGDAPYHMAGIEVRKGMPDADEGHYSQLPDRIFATENGTILGLTEEEILSMQGRPDTVWRDGDYKVFYYVDWKSDFCHSQMKGEYVILYEFLNGKLERFSFGFVEP